MLLAKGIKAIFYDLDGTLRFSEPQGRDFFVNEVVRLGISISAEDRLRATRWEHFYFAGSDEIRADSVTFSDHQAFWLNFSRRQLIALGVSAQVAEELTLPLHDHMNEHYRPNDILMPNLQETLKTLKEAGLILAVVSNRDEPYQEYLQELGLAEYFDFTLAAGEVKSWKPDKEVFEHALRMAGVTAEETIYVGDNYYADVVGARNARIRPILFDVDRIFDQPDCPVISSHQQLLDLLKQEDAWADEKSELRASWRR